MSSDAFEIATPNIQVPHIERPGIAEMHQAPAATIIKPVLAYDYPRRVAGGNPVWQNRGTPGSAGDAVGPGGAANPTALVDLPGYSFDGGDIMEISAGDPTGAVWLEMVFSLDQVIAPKTIYYNELGNNAGVDMLVVGNRKLCYSCGRHSLSSNSRKGHIP